MLSVVLHTTPYKYPDTNLDIDMFETIQCTRELHTMHARTMSIGQLHTHVVCPVRIGESLQEL